MPHKYLDELRLVSPLKLSSVKANTQVRKTHSSGDKGFV